MTDALSYGARQPTSGRDLPPQTDRRTGLPTNEVVALYASGCVSFRLAVGATLEDLTDRLNRYSEHYIGIPTAVYLKVDAATPRVSVLEL